MISSSRISRSSLFLVAAAVLLGWMTVVAAADPTADGSAQAQLDAALRDYLARNSSPGTLPYGPSFTDIIPFPATSGAGTSAATGTLNSLKISSGTLTLAGNDLTLLSGGLLSANGANATTVSTSGRLTAFGKKAFLQGSAADALANSTVNLVQNSELPLRSGSDAATGVNFTLAANGGEMNKTLSVDFLNMGSNSGGTTLTVVRRSDGSGGYVVHDDNTTQLTGGENHINVGTVNIAGLTLANGVLDFGAGSLVKTGEGTLVMNNGNPTFTGSTTINSGTLSFGRTTATTNQLVINGGVLKNVGSIGAVGSSTLDMPGVISNYRTSAFGSTGGEVLFGSVGPTNGSNLTINVADRTITDLQIAGAQNLTLSGTLNLGNGVTLNKAGLGKLTLNNANVGIANNANLGVSNVTVGGLTTSGGSPTLTINNGATLATAGSVLSVTGPGSILTIPPSIIRPTTFPTYSSAGTSSVSRSGGLGTQTLTGANSYTFGTTLDNGGILSVQSDGNLGGTWTGNLRSINGTVIRGSGYTSMPTVTVAGTGTGATARVNMGRDFVLSNYGSGATATAVMGVMPTISSGGYYSTVPTVTINGGSGAGTVAADALQVFAVNVPNLGGSYLTAPTITLSGGGTDAPAIAHVVGITTLNGGTITLADGFSSTRPVLFNANGGTLSVSSGTADFLGNLTVAAGATLTKVGAGTWNIKGTQNFGAGSVLQFGSGPPPGDSASATPEPATSVCLAAGALAALLCWLWRRRK